MSKRKMILLTVCLSFLASLVYWVGIAAPKKEVILKRDPHIDDSTQEIVTIYAIYYRWDGIEEKEPWWVVFKKYGEWKVLALNDVNDAKEAFNYVVDFNSSWVDNYRFSPQSSRYQSLLMTLDFQPTFSDEKSVFFEILREIEK